MSLECGSLPSAGRLPLLVAALDGGSQKREPGSRTPKCRRADIFGEEWK
jgi:hypothetical protein